MSRPSRILLLVFVVLVTACSADAPPAGTIPTVEDAREMLDRAVSLAHAGDFEGLCSLGDGNCRRQLETAGREAVPPDPPTVVDTRTIPTTTTAGNQTHLGGVVLILCGIDANGNHYDSEMLVLPQRPWPAGDQPRLLGHHEDCRQCQPSAARDLPARHLLT